ncbi:MAG: LysM peptidoglycan-binding domain-containing protein [Anaerolineales bacterium]
MFGRAIDKLSDRDEIKKLEEAEKKIQELEKQLDEAVSDDELSETEERIQELEKELRKSKSKEAREAFIRKKEAKRTPVKKYVVGKGDTFSGLAKKYYGDPGKYMVIYEANKEVIGDDPDLIIDGTELVIPKLPGEKGGGYVGGSGPQQT